MPLIVIEGLDGSGKATNAELLRKTLTDMGKDVIKINFPDYDSDSSALVKMYLAGKFGSKPEDVNAYAASAFYAVDRYASYKSKWKDAYERGAWIVADRYTTSNAVHQASKLEDSERDRYLDWLYEFEFDKLGLPKPDMVIYLDLDPKVSQKLMTERYKGDNSKKDIHESDIKYLEHCRNAARFAADRLGWTVVSPCENGTLLPIDKVFEKVYNCIKETYGDKL